ncbi:hypothetical protein ADUPG1_007717 [Aduncisulcus paluster]|uniref:DUF659 domain-containing protein n=1 Tax=Aduncisulcus paluster TaxID=2918883 RepID=A0ABQ5KSG4_9EUKA|nr:hypothetical protein ADUPG1_007717 [Aduncisulcus paluster]
MVMLKSSNIYLALDYVDLEMIQRDLEKARLAQIETIQTSRENLQKDEEEEDEEEESMSNSIVINRSSCLDDITVPREEMVKAIIKILNKHNIQKCHISAIITDREKIMVSIANQLLSEGYGFVVTHCSVHIVNIIIREYLQDMSSC